jgi:hypothetical protein
VKALVLASIAVQIALAEPPQGRPPNHRAPAGWVNVARGRLVYARPGTFWAPGQRGEPQAGLQRLTDGILAGRAPLRSSATILLAPYTADLPSLPLADVPAALRASMTSGFGQLEVDLGGIYAVRALVLEADASGDYRVEASANGRFWRSLWTAPVAFGEQGYVVRSSGPLLHPQDVRYVRVSGAASYGVGNQVESFPGENRRTLYAVTELEVLCAPGRARSDTILPGMNP